MAELTPTERVELVEIAELLHNSMGTMTDKGILIDRVYLSSPQPIGYFDTHNEDVCIREMSATAYVAEFYKVCGGSLDTADFDNVMARINFIGAILGNNQAAIIGFDELKEYYGDESVKPLCALIYEGYR